MTAEAERAEKIRCIVVEDHPQLNDVYCSILGYESGIEIMGRAFSGEELEALLGRMRPDVVLLDIEMSERMQGLEVCRRITKQYPDVRVVMLTCHDEEETILMAYEAGAVDYVLKTGSVAEIVEAVRQAFRNESPIRQHAAPVIRRQLMELEEYRSSLLYTASILSSLTATELDILRQLTSGKKQREIARERSIELGTVKAHVGGILKKFQARRTSEVVSRIKKDGLTQLLYHSRE